MPLKCIMSVQHYMMFIVLMTSLQCHNNVMGVYVCVCVCVCK